MRIFKKAKNAKIRKSAAIDPPPVLSTLLFDAKNDEIGFLTGDGVMNTQKWVIFRISEKQVQKVGSLLKPKNAFWTNLAMNISLFYIWCIIQLGMVHFFDQTHRSTMFRCQYAASSE